MKSTYRWFWLFGLALVTLLSSYQIARADSDTIADPPRTQQAGAYTIEYLSPGNDGPKVSDNLVFRFRVSNAAGQPVDGLNLNMTAIRNYSGQVKKEHNGPRTPNIGPVALQAAGKPGEYQANMSFEQNGHWSIKLDGAALGDQSVQFRQPIAAQANTEAGINWDWLVWVGIMIVVIGIVAIIRSGGEKFPLPTAELAHLEGGK